MNDGVIFYKSHFDNIKDLSNEEIGIIFRACMTGEDLPMSAHVKMAFNFINAQVKRDIRKYAEITEKRRAAGRLGGIAKGLSYQQRDENQEVEEIAKIANANFAKQEIAKIANESNNNNNNNNNNNKIKSSIKIDDSINRECGENCTAVAVPLPPLDVKKKEFIDSLSIYNDRYPQEMLDNFAEYWTEPNKSHTKMRYQMEKTWDTARRLAIWARREKSWRGGVQGNGKTSMFEEIARLNQTYGSSLHNLQYKE